MSHLYEPFKPETDAFSRLRTSEPFTLGDYKHLYAIDPDFIDISVGTGASISFDRNQAAAILQSGTSSTGYCIHQTKRYHHYMPGKSQLIFSSFNFGSAQQNVTKRTGYFDDRDGIFLEQAPNGTLSFVIRSFVSAGIGTSERRIPQSQWNKDKLDGTGVSGFNIDITKTQLFLTDFEWLGVGRVRCGFSMDGKNIIAHEFYNSNNLNTVYMSNPNLPVRCEVRNSGAQVGAGGSLIQICSTVISEGGYTEAGREFSHATNLRTVGVGTTVPIISIKLKNNFKEYPNRATVKLEDISVFTVGANVKYQVIKLRNSTGINGAWITENSESVVEYNQSATGVTTSYSEDFLGGYASGDSQNSQKPSAATSNIQSGPTSKKNFLSQNFDSTDSEVFAVLVSNIGDASTNVGVSLRWREIY